MGLVIRGWRRLGLGVEMEGVMDQGVETFRFRGGDGGGLGIREWRMVGLWVEMGGLWIRG